MKIGKTVYVVLLTIFCLAIMVVAVFPSGSSAVQYDPSYDVNHDGVIDMKDLGNVAARFNPLSTGNNPTLPVNVTNPLSMTLVEDVNITTFPWSYGEGFTNLFATQGYDRMFVSAAIVDVSNHADVGGVGLISVDWTSGVINATPVPSLIMSDNLGLNITKYSYSQLPVSGSQSPEFAVKASNCSLGFQAAYWPSMWVYIRVYIYLTFGTSSPPSVQDTYVTNFPPTSSLQTFAINFSNNGWNNPQISCGGYSRLSILLRIRSASIGLNSSITVRLVVLDWSSDSGANPSSSFEFLNANDAFNVTIYSSGGWSGPSSYMTETKAPYCTFAFATQGVNLPANWYVIIDYAVYLRND